MMCKLLALFIVIIVGLVLGQSSPRGYNCSAEEKYFQFNNFELAGLHICDPDTIWRLAQLSMPDADVFFDVGGNLGYTAAMIFGLWSPGHGFNRLALRQAIQDAVRKNTTTNHEQTTTFCNDGRARDIPMICRGQPIQETTCMSRKNMRVFSFDGQIEHVTNQRKIIYSNFPQVQPNRPYPPEYSLANAQWEYIHAAVSDAATAAKGKGYFVVDKQELGELVLEIPKRSKYSYLPVELTSVDKFCEERRLDHVDVLKVDTEGNDIRVLQGAEKTLRDRGVKMIAFECMECMRPIWRDLYTYLDGLGFDCYLHGVNSMVVRMTNCWPHQWELRRPDCGGSKGRCPGYMRYRGRKWVYYALDSNGYCAHRTRAAGLAALLDQMSLHHYTPKNQATEASALRGHYHKDAMLSVTARDVSLDAKNGNWTLNARGDHWYHDMFGRDVSNGNKTFWARFNLTTEPFWTDP